MSLLFIPDYTLTLNVFSEDYKEIQKKKINELKTWVYISYRKQFSLIIQKLNTFWRFLLIAVKNYLLIIFKSELFVPLSQLLSQL